MSATDEFAFYQLRKEHDALLAEIQRLDNDCHVAAGILAENERTIADSESENQRLRNELERAAEMLTVLANVTEGAGLFGATDAARSVAKEAREALAGDAE